MKHLLFAILFLANLLTNAKAQDASIFPKGEIATVNNHTGTVWLNELSAPDTILNYSIAFASFAPAAKLDWHVHPAGQHLLITEGVGYYQEKGKPIQVVRKGDVIKCLPDVEHWHGAAPKSSFAYIGITPAQKGKTIWRKRVSNEEYNSINEPVINDTNSKQEVIALSKSKWQWMAEKNTESLAALFHEKSMFVHMGGSWGKEQEIDVIKTGRIWYKKADVYSASVNIIGNTAILLNDIDLVAVVGGNEVVNPFMVTEVYIREDGKWKMGSLTFSRLTRPVKSKTSGN